MIANTPSPPYYAVIFTSLMTDDTDGYQEMGALLESLAQDQEGFLGMESVRDGLGITVSYWKDTACIKKWKANADHLVAQKKGRSDWYDSFKTRVCLVERDYGFNMD